MRTFLAIPIPAEVRDTITAFTLALQKQFSHFRWVSTENYHLTLKFLGDISEKQFRDLDEDFTKTIFPAAFTMQITGCGAFPSPKSAKVFWLGFNLPQELKDLQQRIEETCLRRGIAPDKDAKFKPHLTLARAKARTSIDIERLPRIQIPTFEVKELNFYKSDLYPSGPAYSVLKKYFLD